MISGCIFSYKCAWLSEGNFTLDPELFKKSVLGLVERYFKEVVLMRC